MDSIVSAIPFQSNHVCRLVANVTILYIFCFHFNWTHHHHHQQPSDNNSSQPSSHSHSQYQSATFLPLENIYKTTVKKLMKKTLNEVEWSAGSGFESEKKEKEIIRNEKLKKELRNEFKQKTRFSF